LRIALLAYPDNPVGTVFIKTFLQNNVPLCCVIMESKKQTDNWQRSIQKMKRDGIATTLKRIYQIIKLKITRQTPSQQAEKNQIPVYWVKSFNSDQCESLLKEIHVELLAIASAPILKPNIFQKAIKGCLNAHPGWLPQYRGLGANAYALKEGHHPGITIHFIDEGIDTGRIIIRERVDLCPGDTIAKVNDRAVERGAVLMTNVIHQIELNSLQLPHIADPKGKNYRIMPYSETKQINQKIKKDFHAFLQSLAD